MKKFAAWKTLIAHGLMKSPTPYQFRIFFKGTLYQILKKKGWFDFLTTPVSVKEISDHFNYTDLEYLQEILNVLVAEKILKITGNKKFQAIPLQNDPKIMKPIVFTDSLVDLWTNYGKSVPERLKGKYVKYTTNSSLPNWENALKSPFYNGMRATALAFTNPIKRKMSGTPIKFVDVGAGTGNGTAQIWSLRGIL